MAHSTRSSPSFARCVYITKYKSAHFARYYENNRKAAKEKPPRLLLYCKRTKKRLQGVMLIQYVKEHSTVHPLVFGTAIQIAYFIQMKGTEVCRFCFRRLLRVRSLRYLLFVQDAAKGALFAVVRCYCLRVGALSRLHAV